MIEDLKVKLLIKKQVPQFVLDEHPKFVSFLEAYYDFLDSTSNVVGKKLLNVSDVDQSLEDFEEQFFNSFLPLIPKNTQINKELIIKNILPLFLSKGSEKSYRLLFRLLFDENIDVEYPGRNVLRASDGRWQKENILRVEKTVFSEYVSDGESLEYYLPYIMNSSDVIVYVDDVLVNNYTFRREYTKIIFTQAPLENSVIKIFYNDFDPEFFVNRKIVGQSSDAETIVEKASSKIIGGFGYFELFINDRNTKGNFKVAEVITSSVFNGDILIPLTLRNYSEINTITITNSGAKYNIGDPVIFKGPSIVSAVAIVSDINSGLIEDLNVITGGSGFQANNIILADTFSNTFFEAFVVTVDTSGIFSANTLTYNSDKISDYSSITLSDLDYGFPANTDANLESVISSTLSLTTINNLGPITSANVACTQISYSVNPSFTTLSSILYDDMRISDLGVIGTISIIDAGEDYEIGDKLIFSNINEFSGQGANAEIANVNSNGAITQIKINDGGLSYSLQNPPIITIDTANGFGANLEVTSIMGFGESYEPVIEDGEVGEIKAIRILTRGSGYSEAPSIDLTRTGDGNAKAVATITDSFIQRSGKWVTSDSLLSKEEIRLQGRDYFIDYSYVINSKVQFQLYKSILKDLLHPAGFVNYSKYSIEDSVVYTDTEGITVPLYEKVLSTERVKTLSGKVNVVADSIIVDGTNTHFNVARDLEIINVGSTIVINDEIRQINAIISNTQITVSNVFTSSINNQSIIVL
jgi:hypothetical protein